MCEDEKNGSQRWTVTLREFMRHEGAGSHLGERYFSGFFPRTLALHRCVKRRESRVRATITL